MAKSLTIKKNLPVILTNTELLGISKELAKANQDKAHVESEKKEVNAGFAAKQKMCDAHIESLSLKISTEREYRDVECEMIFDHENRTKTTYRKDTGEQVECEKLTSEDMQEELNL